MARKSRGTVGTQSTALSKCAHLHETYVYLASCFPRRKAMAVADGVSRIREAHITLCCLDIYAAPDS